MGAWGTTRCEVLEPERLLQISWKNPPIDGKVADGIRGVIADPGL